MSGCIVTACTQACEDPCPIAALTERIYALEKAAEPSGFLIFVSYLVDNAANLLLISAGIMVLVVFGYWLANGGPKAFGSLVLKSASFSATSAEITFESAAQEVSAMMDAVQDYVVQDAALVPQVRALLKATQPSTDAEGLDQAVDKMMPLISALLAATRSPKEGKSPPIWRQASFSDQPPKPDLQPLSILWVQETAESRAFERKVIETMGNRIETRIGTEAARTRLLAGAVYDLVVVEDAAPDATGQSGGLDLAFDLIHGMITVPGIGTPQKVVVGAQMRLALFCASPDLAAHTTHFVKKSGMTEKEAWKLRYPDVLVTDEFIALRRSIRWLQVSKAPVKPEKK
jgi:hypothetical protein